MTIIINNYIKRLKDFNLKVAVNDVMKVFNLRLFNFLIKRHNESRFHDERLIKLKNLHRFNVHSKFSSRFTNALNVIVQE